MTSIGVAQGASALQLHSCPACGRHSWRRDGVEVDRSTLLAALKVRKPEPAIRREPRPPAPAAPAALGPPATPVEDDRRSELQRLLTGFTVHGRTS